MKSILLTSTALVGLAGAAAADVSWSGAATLGYNDDIRDGVYADVDLDVSLSTELNNGVTAAAKFGFELADDRGPENAGGNDFVADNNILLSLTSDAGGLYYGDTAYAAETYWSGVTNMAQDGFSEQDGETVLRGEFVLGGITAGASYFADNVAQGAGSDELRQLSVGAAGDFGGFSFTAAYQEEDDLGGNGNGDYNPSEVLGISVGTSLAGADLTLAYASSNDEDSIGVEVAYPVGDVTLTAFYVAESADLTDDDGEEVSGSYGVMADYASGPLSAKAWFHGGADEDVGINLGYDLGNGLALYAGYSDDDGQYAAGEYDLGGGAKLTVAYAEDEDNATNDEIGPNEYLHGTTVAVSMSF